VFLRVYHSQLAPIEVPKDDHKGMARFGKKAAILRGS
jgi:hypothetical protein